MKKLLALPILISFITTGCSTFSKGGSSKDVYSGHGVESVSKETLAKYAPPALPPELASRVRNLLEVQAPGLGMVGGGGDALYFTWAVSGVSQVWKTDGPLRFPEQMTSGNDQTTISDLTPDGKYLIVSRDRAGEENPGLYLLPTAGGELIEIQHKKGVRTRFEFVNNAGDTIFFTANDIKPDSYALYSYNLETKKKELLFSEDGLWFVADVMNERAFLLGKATGALTAEYWLFDLADKTVVPVIGQNEKEEYYVTFGTKMNEYFVLTPKFSEFRRLYRIRQGGKGFEPLTPDVPRDVESFSMPYNRLRLYIQWNDAGYTKLEVRDPYTMKELKLPEFKNADHVYPGTPSRFGRFIPIGVETSLRPRTSYVYDWKTLKLTQWVKPSLPETNASKFVPTVLESYTARDGTKIPMLVTRPPQCAKQVCPVIVHFHGGPEGQSRPGFNRTAQLFATSGFVFVEPNVRGSDGYGKTWIAADDGAKRLSVITDIEDASKHIRKTWAVDGVAPKVGVMGWSYGGYSTLMAMTKFAGSYDAGVALVGMSNLRSFLLNTAPYRRKLRISEYGDPEKDREALEQLSPTTYLNQVKSPLMIIQGASDPRVPVGEAVQMRNALQSKGITAPLIIFEDEGHGSGKRDNRVLELGHTIKFFQEHLK